MTHPTDKQRADCGTTHHLGCACNETRHAQELAAARAKSDGIGKELEHIFDEVYRWRMYTATAESTRDALKSNVTQLQSELLKLIDSSSKLVAERDKLIRNPIAGTESQNERLAFVEAQNVVYREQLEAREKAENSLFAVRKQRDNVEADLEKCRERAERAEVKVTWLRNEMARNDVFADKRMHENHALKSRCEQLEAIVAGMRDALTHCRKPYTISTQMRDYKIEKALSTTPTDYERRVQGLLAALKGVIEHCPNEGCAPSGFNKCHIHEHEIVRQALAEFRGKK